MKRTVEIEDDLEERVEGIEEELKEDFINYLKENKDMTDFNTYYQHQACDNIHELVDGWTPIYYSEIDGLYYLYGDEFEESYKNAGFGDGTEDNHRQVAIYCYLESKGFDYLRELESAFDDIFNHEDEDINKLIKYIEEEM